jgi:hypothetical protein
MISTATSHAGNLILGYIKTNKISRASLSRKLGISYPALYRLLRQTKMNTWQVEAFSHALKHDFFIDFSNLMPKNYHSNLKPNSDIETRLAQLETDLKQVTIERDILLKVMQK